MGGRCIPAPDYAELGTLRLQLTPAGREDPLFGKLDSPFFGQAGHEDHVTELPPGAVLLASSELVKNQAFKFEDAPIYCTEFHPELDRNTFLQRVRAYPQYIERITGATDAEFSRQCTDTPGTRQLLERFARFVSEVR